MNGDELLDKMGLIDPAYVEAADGRLKKTAWRKWAAVAACLCIIAGFFAIMARFGGVPLILSYKSTAKVFYGNKDGISSISRDSLIHFTEEELFTQERMYAFRGRVSSLANITIDFNGDKEVRCIATILIEEVYQGNLKAGQKIKTLLPCGIDTAESSTEGAGIISRIESGMEGIFIPRIYDKASYWEQNGATLMLADIADCGLMDGLRWVFLSTDKGLVFERNAYLGAKHAASLDEVEEYVTEMLP